MRARDAPGRVGAVAAPLERTGSKQHLMGMTVFSHLVADPRTIAGGIAFTVNEVDLGQMVVVSDAALAKLVPAAKSDRERLAYVMTHMAQLTDAALRKTARFKVPELIVLKPDDFED